MATIPDHALPNCTNPQHPRGLPTRMIFLETKGYTHVFACQACKDVNRKLSVRVMTDQFYKREVRKTLAAQGGLLAGPMRRRQRTPGELGLMREMSLDAARAREASKSIGWDSEHRKSKDGKFELVEYKELGNGALQIQMAINGKLVLRWTTTSPAARNSGLRKRTGRGWRAAASLCFTCMATPETR